MSEQGQQVDDSACGWFSLWLVQLVVGHVLDTLLP